MQAGVHEPLLDVAKRCDDDNAADHRLFSGVWMVLCQWSNVMGNLAIAADDETAFGQVPPPPNVTQKLELAKQLIRGGVEMCHSIEVRQKKNLARLENGFFNDGNVFLTGGPGTAPMIDMVLLAFNGIAGRLPRDLDKDPLRVPL